MNLSPRHLHIFVTLADSLSFHKAADQLHMTQPTLSKLVRTIEESVGVRLFERSTRHVGLTRDGQALLEVARKVVSGYQTGLNNFEQMVRLRNQRMAIAALPTLAATLLPRLIRTLGKTNPQAQVQVFDLIANEAMELLYDRKVDIVLAARENTVDGLRFTKLFVEPFVLMHRPDVAVPLKRWDIEGLAALPIISMPEGTSTRAGVDQYFSERGATFTPAFALRDLNTISQFVRAGCGMALLPLSAARPFIKEDLRILTLKGAPNRQIGIFTLKGQSHSKLTLQVMRDLVEMSAQMTMPIESENQSRL
ncbi:LysR family transcriptional regulator [Advenella kashmirensis W13003]|uniref:LysR family transcriptional regulator n=1 Tax=Advenella kashmirensis W13003 TaxID=1424334 RepID=V8QL08_9BURK|nr:LysR family transcriptional regulator [Advenella kashmirensis]ETF00631.1 LysR family transcriptional regulator [Advenella kashmirensis W13003]